MVKELLASREIRGATTSFSQFVRKYQGDQRYTGLVALQYSYMGSSSTQGDGLPRNFKSLYQGSSTVGEHLSLHGGSQAREIFEDLMQEELTQVRKVKSLLKNMMQGNDIHFADSSFETFTATLQKVKSENELNHMDFILMHEYYTDKLKQKEK